MASKESRFNGRVFGYHWADCEWVATVFEFPECAEVWISARCEPHSQMMLAFTTPVAEAEAIDGDFIIAHPAAKQTMTDLAYEYQMDIPSANPVNGVMKNDVRKSSIAFSFSVWGECMRSREGKGRISPAHALSARM